MKNKLIRIIIWAFILNTLWEFVQCIFLYDMWDWPFWESTLWMWGAIFGDILIVLALWKTTTLLMPSADFYSPDLPFYFLLLLISFLSGIFLEWAAIYLDLWNYDSDMTTIKIFNYSIGLSPVLQITFLPALSIYLANKKTSTE